MELTSGKLFVNKTWRFLIPCLADYGSEFLSFFNSIFKIGAGIHDQNLNSLMYNDLFSIFIIIDTNLYYNEYQNFINWIADKEYYLYNYSIKSNIKFKVVVLKVPIKYQSAYISFFKGEYSKMYLKSNIDFLFPMSTPDKDILLKNPLCTELLIDEVNEVFNINSSKIKNFTNPIKEYSLPPERENEILNCTNNGRKFLSYELDKFSLIKEENIIY